MITLSAVLNDADPLAMAANYAAWMAAFSDSYSNKQAVQLPGGGKIYFPANANLPRIPYLYGEGESNTQLVGGGHLMSWGTQECDNGPGVWRDFSLSNPDVSSLGDLITFTGGSNQTRPRMENIQFGLSNHHWVQTGTGTVFGMSLNNVEFTQAKLQSRLMQHFIGYRETNIWTHHNKAGMQLAQGVNALSIADVVLHGRYEDQGQYHVYAGGDYGSGEINGITFEGGTTFARAWLNAPANGTKGGDLILETRLTPRKVLGVRFNKGCKMLESTVNQLERISLSPNGVAPGYIGPVDIGDMTQFDNVPLWTQVNGKVKVFRSDMPVRQERTEITDSSGFIFHWVDRNGKSLPQGISCELFVHVVDASNGANQCSYRLEFLGNSNGLSDFQFNILARKQRGAVDVGINATPFFFSPDFAPGSVRLGYLKGAVNKVVVNVEMVGAYNG